MASGSCDFTWKVDGPTLQQMKQATVGHVFESSPFQIAGLTWRLKAYPNGNNRDSAGYFNLYIHLVSKQSLWKHVECCYQMRCNETHCSFTFAENFVSGASSGWPTRTMLFDDIQQLDSVSLSITICVNKILLNNDQLFIDNSNSIKSQSTSSLEWKLKPEILESVKDAHDGKRFMSEIFDGMWCLALKRRGIYLDLYLYLCILPTGNQRLNISCSADAVLTGRNEQSISQTQMFFCNAPRVVAPFYRIPRYLNLADIKECNALVLKAKIVINDHSDSMHENESEEKHNLNGAKSATNQDIENVLSSVHSLSDKLDQMNRSRNAQNKELMGIKSKLDVSISSTNTMDRDFATKINGTESKMDLHQRNTTGKLDDMARRITSTLDSIKREVVTKINQLQSHRDVMERTLSSNLQSIGTNMTENMASQFSEITRSVQSIRDQSQQMMAEVQDIVALQDTMQSKEVSTRNELEIWMTQIVKLPQCLNQFKELGFQDLKNIQNLNENDLKEIGINEIVHRKQIMRYIEELEDNQIEVIRKDIKIRALKVAIQGVLECFIPRTDTKTISNFHAKCSRLRKYVEHKDRDDSPKPQIGKDEQKKHIPLIVQHLDLNKSEGLIQRVAIMNGKRSKKQHPVIKSQLELFEKYKVYDHSRLDLKDGCFGLKAKMAIPKSTVIGEYRGKGMLSLDLDSLSGTQIHNEINRYAFDAPVRVVLPLREIKRYENIDDSDGNSDHVDDEDEDIDMDSNHNIGEPQRKRRRMNEEEDIEVEHQFNIVLDVHSMKEDNLLRFMNDSRKHMVIQQPTDDDEEYWNVEFVTIYFKGWPRIFVVARKDIAENEELLSFYGNYSDVMKQEEALKERHKKLRSVLEANGMEHIADDMLSSQRIDD